MPTTDAAGKYLKRLTAEKNNPCFMPTADALGKYPNITWTLYFSVWLAAFPVLTHFGHLHRLVKHYNCGNLKLEKKSERYRTFYWCD